MSPVRRYDHTGDKASASNYITLKVRADADPLTVRTQASWTTEGTITSDDSTILPATITSGKLIETQLEWTTASPYTTAAVSGELRIRAAVRRETFEVRYLYVVLERDHELIHGAPDPREPDDVFSAIVAFQDTAQVAYIDEQKRTYQALVEQGITYSRELIDEREYRTVARLELSIVSGPS